MKRKVIRLTEADLHSMIRRSVEKILMRENVGIDGNNPTDWVWQMARDCQYGLQLPCGYYCEGETYGDGEIDVYLSEEDANDKNEEPVCVIRYDETGELARLAKRFRGDTVQILDAYLKSSGFGH